MNQLSLKSLTIVPMRQKLDFETSLACRKPGYNLKLFDRYIDVTPFREESSLYPICREWIKNHPDSKKPRYARVNCELKSYFSIETFVMLFKMECNGGGV